VVAAGAGQAVPLASSAELDGIVIELRQNNDADDRTIASALLEFEAAIAAQHPRNIVLDMRMNGGGDLNTTRIS